MAPTNRGVAKQLQNQSRQTAATPVFSHDGTNIVITQPASSSSTPNRTPFASLHIPFSNVPPGVTRQDGPIDSPFTQFTQSQQSYNGINMGLNPMSLHQPHQQQQFHAGDPLSSSSSAPTPTPTPGPANGGFQGGYYGNNNNNMLMRSMGAPNPNGNFYPNIGMPGTLAPFGNGMPSMQSPMQSPAQEPFSSPSMQQGQYGMPVNSNMGFGFPGQQHQQNGFNMQGGMYNMMSYNSSSNNDYSSYEPPSTSSSDTPPDRDFSTGNGDGGMDVELDIDVEANMNGSYSTLLSPSTEMLTSPMSDRGLGGDNSMDTVVKGEDFGSTASLSPPLLGEAKSISANNAGNNGNKSSGGMLGGNAQSKTPLPSSKEKEQNKQKLYRNRKSEFTNKMRDELLEMGMLPSTRVTHAPEIMSKTADTLRDYRELLELIQSKVEGMPTNIAAVPGAVKKLLNENGSVFNHTRQPPQLSLAQQTPQQQQQQQVTHSFKPDIKVPLGANVNGVTNGPLPARVTRSGAHAF